MYARGFITALAAGAAVAVGFHTGPLHLSPASPKRTWPFTIAAGVESVDRELLELLQVAGQGRLL